MIELKGIDHEVRMVDHEHDEPITMGLLAEDVLKGVKMLVDDIFTENGVFVPEQLPVDARRYYFEEIAKLGVTVDVTIS